jgi:PAP2 superfamily/Wax ester synthase/diacylglycerol acyltransferase catalytic domain/WS/DGAT C-terminal domain
VVLHRSGPGAAAQRANERPRLLPELTIGLATFAVYVVVESLGGQGRSDTAERNGRALLAAEERLRVPVEVWLNGWLVPHQRLRVVANYEYAFTYLVTAFVLLVWLYRHRPEVYRWARSSFILLNVLGLTCFALYPVAPPRLLDPSPFVDTVTTDGTWGSWGSPMIDHANQLAAMPSLHIAWAVWVSVVLACVTSRWWVQGLSGVHITVTLLVILATANHYLFDAVGGALLVWLTVLLMSLWQDRPGSGRPPRVGGADAFFLAIDSPTSVQQVGGLVVADGPAAGFPDRVRAHVQAHLDGFPRLRQRLSPASRWRRPRWLPQSTVDWDWHVPSVTLNGGGMSAVHDLVARLELTPLPRDRPLWRLVAVTGFTPGKVAVVLVVHHTVGDGVATIAQAVTMLEPPERSHALAEQKALAPPGPGKRAVGTLIGLLELANDGPNRHPLPAGPGLDRTYATQAIPLRTVRLVARLTGVRAPDVLLSLVAGAVRRLMPGSSAVRTAVPLAMRAPGAMDEGNVTAAVMVDLPCGPMTEVARLRAVARHSERLRSGTRALGSRFVMRTVCTVLPPVALGWFAGAVYGRRTFSAIVSNMPGPVGAYGLAGASVEQVYPILPLAPGAPLAVGAIGWDGMLFLGVSVDPDLFPDADRFAAATCEALAELIGDLSETPASAIRFAERFEPVSPAPVDGFDGDGRTRVDGDGRARVDGDGRADGDGRLQARASTSRARSSGVSNVDPNTK